MKFLCLDSASIAKRITLEIVVGLLMVAGASLRAQVSWRLMEGLGPTKPGGGLCYDEARGELVRWNSPYETWVNGGNRWERRVPSSSPPARANTLMAYDSDRRLVVLAAGDNKFDVWEWNAVSWVWRGSNAAIQTNTGALGYDRLRHRTVLTTDSLKTFEWDGAVWTQTATMASNIDTMAWNPLSARLEGLQVGALVQYGGTSWSPLPGPALTSSSGSEMVFDRRNNRLVVVRTGAGGTVDVFHRMGSAWTALPTVNLGVHSGPRTIYHPGLDRTLYGGGDAYWGAVADYWLWDGTQWLRSDGAVPPGRVIGAAYDAARHQVVAHGLATQGTVPYTFLWDGQHWTTASPAHPLPANVSGPMVYDGQNQRVLLVSPANGLLTTWAWDGSDWSQVVTQNAPPGAPTVFKAMSYDSGRHEVVLVTGSPTVSTWIFDGTDWQQASTATAPPGTADRTLVYDPIRQRTVMYSGLLQDTWEWDGTNWTRIVHSTIPPYRTAQTMTWDALRQRVVMTGGHTYQGLMPVMLVANCWEWDGLNWVQRALPGLPAQSSGVFLDTREGLFLHIGAKILNSGAGFEPTSETWQLRPAPLASASPYGSGCSAQGESIQLDAMFVPFLGNPEFALRVPHAAPQIGILIAYGTTQASLTLGGGCVQLVDSVTATDFRLSDANGEARFAMPIPAAAGLLGATFFAQAASLGTSGPLGGLSLTGGMRFQLGN